MLLTRSSGFSLLDIVQNDPKDLTIYFGGKRGRKIRDNYLAMTHKVTLPNGEQVTKPVIEGLNHDSHSHTFRDERGLLFSTQFAQPALTLMEMAELEDLRSKGLVQENGTFAGHSLGEYSALGAFTSFMPIEGLLNLVFYRGLTMQTAMRRDQSGRTDFSMVAVNPSRVSKSRVYVQMANGGYQLLTSVPGFTQKRFEAVVQLIGFETHLLLEVVNYNVEQQQYVCAGHVSPVYLLSQFSNPISQVYIASCAVDTERSLQPTITPLTSRTIHCERASWGHPSARTGVASPFHSDYPEARGCYHSFERDRRPFSLDLLTRRN